MAIVVLTFRDDSSFGQYLAQLEDAALSGSIQKWMIQKHSHILVGEDLPAPVALGTFVNNHCFTFSSEYKLKVALDGATLPSVYNIKNKGGMFTFAGLDGTIISAEAQAVLDRMTGLTQVETDAIITFVNAESASIGNGNWALVDEFFSFGLAGATNPLIGWIAKTAVNNGAVLSVEGALFAGAEWIDSDFNPTLDAVNYSQNNALAGLFIISKSNNNIASFGVVEGGAQTIHFITATETMNFGNNTATFAAALALSYVNELLITNRVAVSTQNLIKNGVEAAIANTPTVGVPNDSIFIGSYNAAGTPTTFLNGTISTAIFGAAVGFDQAAHYTNHLQFLIDLGTFAQPVLDRYTALTQTETDAITAFVNSEVLAGNWGLYDEFFCFSLNATDRLIGMKSKTATNNGATFDINGAIFAGAEWIDSNFNPTADAINYVVNNAILGTFVKVKNTVTGRTYYGAQTPSNSILVDNIGSAIIADLNGQQIRPIADIDSDSLYVNALESGNEALYKDGVAIISNAGVGVSIPTENFFIGAANNGGATGFISGTLSTFIIGSGAGFDQPAHNTNIRTLLTDLGVTLP